MDQVFYRGLPGFMVGRVMTVLMFLLKRAIKQSEVGHGLAMFAAGSGVALRSLSGAALPRRLPQTHGPLLARRLSST